MKILSLKVGPSLEYAYPTLYFYLSTTKQYKAPYENTAITLQLSVNTKQWLKRNLLLSIVGQSILYQSMWLRVSINVVIDAVVNNVAVQILEKTSLKEIRMCRDKPKRWPYGSKFKVRGLLFLILYDTGIYQRHAQEPRT